MLLTNFNITNQRIGRQVGGLTANLYANLKTTTFRNFQVGNVDSTETKKTSFPNASYNHYAYVLAVTAGRFASRDTTKITVSTTAFAAQGNNLTANADIVFTTDANANAIASLSINDTIVFTTGANAVAVAALSAMALINFATTALSRSTANLSASDTITFLTNAANFQTVNLSGTTEIDSLTASSIASEVWNSLASSFNVAGTMGEKLNLAGSGGVDYDALRDAVWAKLIESGFTAEDLMKLFASVLVSKVSGAGTGIETFRDINDTVDRVISTVDSEGNRTDVDTNVT